jgi:hypothetical protein
MAYTFACLGVRQIAHSPRLFSPANERFGSKPEELELSKCLPLFNPTADIWQCYLAHCHPSGQPHFFKQLDQ